MELNSLGTPESGLTGRKKKKTHVINNISFSVLFLGSFRMLRTNEINLIILKLVVSTIHVKYVICIVNPKSVFDGRKENNDTMSKSIRRTF